MLRGIARYAINHWRGEQGLAWSFWVNFIAVRAFVFFAQANLLPDKGFDYSTKFLLIVSLILFFHVLLFIWQAVGVLRAADRYVKETGSQAHAWGAQICLAVAVFITFSASLEAWQTTIPVSKEENHLVRMDREHASKYELRLDPASGTLTLEGSIELGITRNLRSLLENSPGVKIAVLKSNGGNIYEARGLANLFRENGIDTHVETNCTSACTSAFVGGKNRTMSPEAKFGFHQYRIDSAIRTIHANPLEEQEKDKQLFMESGVNEDFVERMFSAPSSGMWFPSTDELLQAGYVHEIRR